jgi:hypothetical protein
MLLIPILLPVVVACGASSAEAVSDDAPLRASIVPTTFTCKPPSTRTLLDLTVKTSKDANVEVSEPHIAPARGKLNSKREADLGNFDMPEGAYTVTLDAAMIGGKAGTLHLIYHDPDGTDDDVPYSCTTGGAEDAGVKCGPKVCGAGESCCNPLSGTCVTPGRMCAL